MVMSYETRKGSLPVWRVCSACIHLWCSHRWRCSWKCTNEQTPEVGQQPSVRNNKGIKKEIEKWKWCTFLTKIFPRTHVCSLFPKLALWTLWEAMNTRHKYMKNNDSVFIFPFNSLNVTLTRRAVLVHRHTCPCNNFSFPSIDIKQ